MAFASKLSVGHQEIDRIIDEVEQTYRAQPTEWLPIAPGVRPRGDHDRRV